MKVPVKTSQERNLKVRLETILSKNRRWLGRIVPTTLAKMITVTTVQDLDAKNDLKGGYRQKAVQRIYTTVPGGVWMRKRYTVQHSFTSAHLKCNLSFRLDSTRRRFFVMTAAEIDGSSISVFKLSFTFKKCNTLSETTGLISPACSYLVQGRWCSLCKNKSTCTPL